MFHLYTPRKRQKTCRFLTFSGDWKLEHWAKMGKFWNQVKLAYKKLTWYEVENCVNRSLFKELEKS